MDEGFSEMLQQVARLVRFGSFVAALPHYGEYRFNVEPCLILNDYNALNPGTVRFGLPFCCPVCKNHIMRPLALKPDGFP